MKRYLMPGVTIILLSILMLTVSCASNRGPKPDATIATEDRQITEDLLDDEALVESKIPTTGFIDASAMESELASIFTDISFDYDSFALKPEAKAILDKISETLLNKTALQIMTEGHCDDRGTNEYNLALGQRRAESAKRYLIQLGVSPKRIFTISYGEEKPLSTDQNEEAWTENRRDHFMIR